jgi:hypothetical protein
MPRLNQKRYELHVMVAMAIYVAVLLLVWPLARTATNAPVKWLLASAPVLPMLYLIGLMARRIRDSDELEQRTHLIALGTSTAVVGALSLVGGFLATAKMLVLDGTVLIWVFPSIMACYGVTRWWAVRYYGGTMACEGDGGIPTHWRVIAVAVMMGAVGVFAYLRNDAQAVGIFGGMAAAFTLIAVIKGVGYWRQRRDASAEARHEG